MLVLGECCYASRLVPGYLRFFLLKTLTNQLACHHAGAHVIGPECPKLTGDNAVARVTQLPPSHYILLLCHHVFTSPGNPIRQTSSCHACHTDTQSPPATHPVVTLLPSHFGANSSWPREGLLQKQDDTHEPVHDVVEAPGGQPQKAFSRSNKSGSL